MSICKCQSSLEFEQLVYETRQLAYEHEQPEDPNDIFRQQRIFCLRQQYAIDSFFNIFTSHYVLSCPFATLISLTNLIGIHY